MTELSLQEARAIALAAQGFTARAKHVRALVERLGVVQIDSVNVLVRSHYLPVFARHGHYERAELDRLSHRAPRALFEYWGHEASLLPVALQPLMRWRMERAGEKAWRHVREMGRRRRGFVEDVLKVVAERGPIGAGDIELGKRSSKGWWEWSDAKRAIEWLFWTGRVTSAGRRNFERLYDLPERVLPARVLAAATPDVRDAQRELVRIASRALGVATETDLRDYYRLSPGDARAAIADLVEAGALEQVRVESWAKPAYLARGAAAGEVDPARVALLSPFDSLIWARERTERLFGMRYRIEIYTPAPQRVHGYYVLPVLLGDQLVARVDLKSDRAGKALLVQAAHAEPPAHKAKVAKALSVELTRMAHWLGLERVQVVGRGDLAAHILRSLP